MSRRPSTTLTPAPTHWVWRWQAETLGPQAHETPEPVPQARELLCPLSLGSPHPGEGGPVVAWQQR